MSPFESYLVAVMDQAAVEARQDGSGTIEAHHLLLAIASGPDCAGRRTLTDAGLDHPGLRDLLEREFAHSLSVAGVAPSDFDGARRERRSATVELPSKMGTSTKLALERGFSAVRRKRDIRPGHLLLGVLRAESGTVPHAFTVAGIDRERLVNRLEHALAEER